MASSGSAEDRPEVEYPSHSERLKWREESEDQQRPNRKDARLDRDYYDGKQLSDKELKILKERGQPPVINNRIAKKINTLVGEEIEKRFDPVAKPRTPKHIDDARIATDLLRYVSDSQEFSRVKTQVAESMFVEGIGIAVKHVDGDKHELRHVPYDRFGFDIHSRHLLFRDAKFLWIDTWLDFEEAEELFPGAKEVLEQAVAQAGSVAEDYDDVPRNWIDASRKRVMVCEMYFRLGKSWHVSFFTKAADLKPPEPTAYLDEQGKHTICPVLAVSCYVDREGNRYGVVRNLRSPQDGINKRESKLTHQLNSINVIAERDVVRQPEEFMVEMHKPDGFAEVEPGTLASPDGPRIQVNRNLDLAQGQVMLLQEAKQNIDGIGPSASNLPELPASASGRAQAMRRKAAALDYGRILDNLRWWSHGVFMLDWACIRQTMTQPTVLRVTDDKTLAGYRFVSLNRRVTRAERFAELMQAQPPPPLKTALETAAGPVADAVMMAAQPMVQAAQQQGIPPDQALMMVAQQHPLMLEMVTVNDVPQMSIDIVIDDAPDTAVLAEEQFATLSEVIGPVMQARPDMAPTLTRALIQSSSLPDKREILEAFDKPQGPPPAQQQLAQQMQAMQLQMAQLQAALIQAQVQKTTADAQLSQARAQSELASIGQGQAPEPTSPLDMAKAEREQVNTRLDVEKTRAQVEKERAGTAKLAAEAASTAHQMMQPEIVEVAIE